MMSVMSGGRWQAEAILDYEPIRGGAFLRARSIVARGSGALREMRRPVLSNTPVHLRFEVSLRSFCPRRSLQSVQQHTTAIPPACRLSFTDGQLVAVTHSLQSRAAQLGETAFFTWVSTTGLSRIL